jgi:hypothetical protein
MQTFLPYPDFVSSAKVLDRQRLGKQRVETIQILNALHEIKPGYRNHPATKMWRGHEFQLALYGLAMVSEWIDRGYTDNVCRTQLEDHAGHAEQGSHDMPAWMGDEAFHLSHQSNLVRKDPRHYRVYFPDVPDDLEYVWPVA